VNTNLRVPEVAYNRASLPAMGRGRTRALQKQRQDPRRVKDALLEAAKHRVYVPRDRTSMLALIAEANRVARGA